MAEERKEGTVKWFSRVKGYGFIAPDGEETEIFVHFSGIEGDGYRNLEKGQRVSFVVEETEKGPQAAAVRDQGFEATSWTAEPTEDPSEVSYGSPEEDSFADDVEDAMDSVEESADDMMDDVKELAEDAVEEIGELAESVGDEIGEVADKVGGMLGDAIDSLTGDSDEEDPPDIVA